MAKRESGGREEPRRVRNFLDFVFFPPLFVFRFRPFVGFFSLRFFQVFKNRDDLVVGI